MVTPSMDPEEAQTLIDKEILVLKTRRNTYARISRLPNELFVGIFTILQGNDYDDVNIREWHHVTHVCRHWRRVALEAAILWTKPPTDLHDYTLAMLERSRTSPLQIDMSLTTSKATCTAILDHIGRVESLIIEQSQPGLQHFQRSLLGLAQEASFLKTLEITQDLGSLGAAFRLSTPVIHQLPSLKTLWLANINFDWMMFPLHNLTTLSLVCLELSKNPSWTQFYNALRHMPFLEDLGFRFDDIQLTSPPHHAVEPLELPLLHTLVINESRASVTSSFLSNTSLPRLRHTYLACSFSESSDSDEYSATISVVLPLIIKGNFGCLDLMTLSNDSFGMTRQSNLDHKWAFRHAMDFTAMDRPRSSAVGTARALMAELAALPTKPALEIVHLHTSVDLTSEQFLELFGHLPQLTTITVRNISSRSIIESLQISPLHPPGIPIPFPKLNSIELYGQPHEDDYTPGLLSELYNCAMERHKNGAGIEKLSLYWDLTQEEVQRLQEFVADVELGEPVENMEDDSDDSNEEDEDSSLGESD